MDLNQKYQTLQNLKKWANIEDDELKNKKALRVLFSTVIDVTYGVVIDSILGKIQFHMKENF